MCFTLQEVRRASKIKFSQDKNPFSEFENDGIAGIENPAYFEEEYDEGSDNDKNKMMNSEELITNM